MNVFWVFAHPEPRSLNGALRDEGLHILKELGHDIRESDLYAMGWKAVADGDDYAHDPAERLRVGRASQDAYESGALTEDVRAEIDKLTWADVVITQFPLWWASAPAILKGWIDRVFVQGFGYGVKDEAGVVLRYGDGALAGRRAMIITSVGARAAGYSQRGLHGELNEVLYPLQRGTFSYAGMSVLPPLLVAGADRATADDYEAAVAELRERLRTLATAEPIPYRRELGGDYGEDDLLLRPHLARGRTGLDIHRS
jgi:NAD(P)H dehydrogenase (quinone)